MSILYQKRVITNADFIFNSSNENVIKITENGTAEAVDEGTATITAVLKQNPSITACISVNVVSSFSPKIVFIGDVPSSVAQYSTVCLTAQYYDSQGTEAGTVSWSFDGADKSNYVTRAKGNTISITCLSPSSVPLVVTASQNDVSISTYIVLEGY